MLTGAALVRRPTAVWAARCLTAPTCLSSPHRPAPATPPDVASAQRQLRLLQWAVPAVTGALVVVSSYAGEQQRQAAAPAATPRGFFVRFTR